MTVKRCQCGERATRHTTRRHFCEQHWAQYLKALCQGRVYEARGGDRPCTLMAAWLVAELRYCSKHVERAVRFAGQAPIEIKEAQRGNMI